MGVMLVLRWVWWRVNAWGEIAAILASIVLAPRLLVGLPNQQEALRLLLMAIGSTTAGVVASLITAPEPMDRLTAFYVRAAPPGFWSHIALIAQQSCKSPIADPRRRLGRSLAAVATCACCVFRC